MNDSFFRPSPHQPVAALVPKFHFGSGGKLVPLVYRESLFREGPFSHSRAPALQLCPNDGSRPRLALRPKHRLQKFNCRSSSAAVTNAIGSIDEAIPLIIHESYVALFAVPLILYDKRVQKSAFLARQSLPSPDSQTLSPFTTDRRRSSRRDGAKRPKNEIHAFFRPRPLVLRAAPRLKSKFHFDSEATSFAPAFGKGVVAGVFPVECTRPRTQRKKGSGPRAYLSQGRARTFHRRIERSAGGKREAKRSLRKKKAIDVDES